MDDENFEITDIGKKCRIKRSKKDRKREKYEIMK
jgi:hypothetical protein